MKAHGWKMLILSAVDKASKGDEKAIDLLALCLEELDQAKQVLIDRGFSWTGLGILEAVQNLPDSD